MRLLLTREIHEPGEYGHRVAASPDSVRPDPWRWELWTTGDEGSPRVDGGFGEGSSDRQTAAEVAVSGVRVRYAPDQLEVTADELVLSGPRRLERPPSDIWILIALSGEASEGPRRIRPGDTLVLEGDDPLDVEILPRTDQSVSLICIRLHNLDDSELRWVP